MFLRLLLVTFFSALFNCAFADPTSSRLTPVDADRMANLLAAVAESINHGQELKEFIDFYADLAIQFNLNASSGVTKDEKFQFYDSMLTTSDYIAVSMSHVSDVQGQPRFELRITSPYSLLTGIFDVNGTVFDHHVAGEGIFVVQATNLTLSFLNVQMSETELKELHLDSLGFALEADSITFKAYGLDVDDMPRLQFEELAAGKIFDGINALSPRHYDYTNVEANSRRDDFIGRFISYQIKGYTMDYVTCWLKENTKKNVNDTS